MIQLKTLLNCIDNSGATIVECVANLRMKRHAKIGDRIIVVVQKQRNLASDSIGSSSSASSSGGSSGGSVSQISAQGVTRVRRGDIRHAVVVRTRKNYQRKNGVAVSFDDNACVLIQKTGEPIGTRIGGVVGIELKDKGWSKILSLAAAHV